MISDDANFTAEQAAKANTALRAALGLPPQRFSAEQFVGMISDEIEQLRAAGKSDGDIAALVSDSTGVTVETESIAQFYADPEARDRPG